MDKAAVERGEGKRGIDEAEWQVRVDLAASVPLHAPDGAPTFHL